MITKDRWTAIMTKAGFSDDDMHRWRAEFERRRFDRKEAAVKLVVAVVGALALLAPPLANTAAAQDRPAPVVELSAGWIAFADDGIVHEAMAGSAARLYLGSRVSVGPELIYINGDNHSHLVLTGNVTFDVLRPDAGGPRRVSPFVVAGGGVFQTRQQTFAGTLTSREGAFTAGGGVRALVGDRATIGVDVRVGWELHIRVNGVVGVRLGR